jgi:hypothetical protein
MPEMNEPRATDSALNGTCHQYSTLILILLCDAAHAVARMSSISNEIGEVRVRPTLTERERERERGAES